MNAQPDIKATVVTTAIRTQMLARLTPTDNWPQALTLIPKPNAHSVNGSLALQVTPDWLLDTPTRLVRNGTLLQLAVQPVVSITKD